HRHLPSPKASPNRLRELEGADVILRFRRLRTAHNSRALPGRGRSVHGEDSAATQSKSAKSARADGAAPMTTNRQRNRAKNQGSGRFVGGNGECTVGNRQHALVLVVAPARRWQWNSAGIVRQIEGGVMCLGGDYCCPSCGPAQGHWRCFCGAWASDSGDDVDENGNLRRKYQAQAEAAERAQAEAEDRLDAELDERDRLAEEYWRSLEAES